jgi:hypothetical protein
MRISRLSTLLVASTALAGSLVIAAPAASAHVACDPGEFYRATSHSGKFYEVGAAQAVNKEKGSATLRVDVGTAHTSTRSFTGSLSASVEGGFWVFAKASATATASVTLETSTTMSKTFGTDVPVPGHSTRTVEFGFRRYTQHLEQYHLYNNTVSSCAVKVDRSTTVVAPYMTTFIIE